MHGGTDSGDGLAQSKSPGDRPTPGRRGLQDQGVGVAGPRPVGPPSKLIKEKFPVLVASVVAVDPGPGERDFREALTSGRRWRPPAMPRSHPPAVLSFLGVRLPLTWSGRRSGAARVRLLDRASGRGPASALLVTLEPVTVQKFEQSPRLVGHLVRADRADAGDAAVELTVDRLVAPAADIAELPQCRSRILGLGSARASGSNSILKTLVTAPTSSARQRRARHKLRRHASGPLRSVKSDNSYQSKAVNRPIGNLIEVSRVFSRRS